MSSPSPSLSAASLYSACLRKMVNPVGILFGSLFAAIRFTMFFQGLLFLFTVFSYKPWLRKAHSIPLDSWTVCAAQKLHMPALKHQGKAF